MKLGPRVRIRQTLVIAISAPIVLLVLQAAANGFAQKALDRVLNGQSCVRCDLRGANLSGRKLHSINLRGAYLIRTNLAGADLVGADLRGAWLLQANLKRANLQEAKLEGAKLIRADLTSANLHKADLRHAKLAGAILTKSRLSEAKFEGATLHSASLKRARGLKKDQFDHACGDRETITPVGIRIPNCSESMR